LNTRCRLSGFGLHRKYPPREKAANRSRRPALIAAASTIILDSEPLRRRSSRHIKTARILQAYRNPHCPERGLASCRDARACLDHGSADSAHACEFSLNPLLDLRPNGWLQIYMPTHLFSGGGAACTLDVRLHHADILEAAAQQPDIRASNEVRW